VITGIEAGQASEPSGPAEPGEPSELSPHDALRDEPADKVPADRAPSDRRGGMRRYAKPAALGIALVCAGVAVFLVVRPDPAPTVVSRPKAGRPAKKPGGQSRPVAVPASTASSGTTLRLGQLVLRAQLPTGWQLSDSRGGVVASEAVIAFSGGTAQDPDHGMFVGQLPLTGPNEKLRTLDESALKSAAQTIEQAVAKQIEVEGGSYRSHGCAVTRAGALPTTVCSGTASGRGVPVSVRAYLRIWMDHATVAVFIAKPTVTGADSANEADRIVASFARED
jgi:hypothetical protein